MVSNAAACPCSNELIEKDGSSRFPTVQFSMNRCDGSSAWYIKQTKNHKSVCVCRTESKSTQSGRHGCHAMCGCNILYPEKDTATGHNHFFCGNSGNQCDNDLPVSKTDRPKERDDCFPNIGSETQTDICYISGRTEI